MGGEVCMNVFFSRIKINSSDIRQYCFTSLRVRVDYADADVHGQMRWWDAITLSALPDSHLIKDFA